MCDDNFVNRVNSVRRVSLRHSVLVCLFSCNKKATDRAVEELLKFYSSSLKEEKLEGKKVN